MISAILSLYSLSSLSTNYTVSNLPNIYNLLISILSMDMDEAKKKEIVQMIKTNLGMSFFEGFKGYILKKYNIDNPLVKLLV